MFTSGGTVFPKTVLVADDSAALRRCLAMVLQDWGCRVLEAADGEEACRIALAEIPELMLLD
jgi:CheY-like chemotaxis protein